MHRSIRPSVRFVAAILVGAAVAVPVVAETGPPDSVAGLPRIVALEDAKTRASLPYRIRTGAAPCNPAIPSVPSILDQDFEPSLVDEVDVARNGAAVAWSTNLSELGVPGTTRDIILYRAKGPTRDRVTDAAGDNDQPSLAFDSRGVRLAWRGSDGARGTTPGNIWLRTVTPKVTTTPPPATGGTGTGTTATTETVESKKITNMVTTAVAGDASKIVGTAYDPSLCARTRVREVGSGVKVEERDARVAFVSTGVILKDRSVAGRPQLFVWREQDNAFSQLTSIGADGFAVNRPSIDASGSNIAFECNADLTPEAADPKLPSRVGNPSKVRQIYLWRQGRGITQLTWSDRDCYAPRISRDGRVVLFCSRGNPIPGGNPDGNFEIFGWTVAHDPALQLRQLTETTSGHSVLPRPSASIRSFAFWSTAAPAEGGATFGENAAQCGPLAYVARGSRITRVGGFTDAQNTQRITSSPVITSPENPITAGPPCVAGDATRVYLITNDLRLNAKLADDDLDGVNGGKDTDGNDKPDDRRIDASLLYFHAARVIVR
ncbi:MAG: hypothetical protein K8T90_20110 [Planctomycetes bacterium]|nr:hypothetical protein [Planctomycetota bacterium]